MAADALSRAAEHALSSERVRRAMPVLAAAIIVVTLAILWAQAKQDQFLVCEMECGETVLAEKVADEYAQYGIEHGLLENQGTHDEPSIYTHNVNIGGLLFVLLEALGVHDYFLKALFPLAAYGLGLWFAFLTARIATNSNWFALLALCLLATQFWGLGAFAFNALRAWHLLAFFLPIYSVVALARFSPIGAPRILGLLIGAMIAFGCGYDLWVISAAVSVAVYIANLERTRTFGTHCRHIGLIIGAFVLPFVLRQIHIVAVLGIGYWTQDFYYSLAIKIPYASLVLPIPPLSDVDAWYKSQHILRPPALPTSSFRDIFHTLKAMFWQVTLPRWGWLALLTVALALLATFSRELRQTILGQTSYRLILPFALGAAIGLTFLAPFSLHVYFKHEFPLLVVPIELAEAAVLVTAGSYALRDRRFVMPAIAVFLVYAGDTFMVHWNNNTHGHYPNLGWAHYIRDHPSERYLAAVYRPVPPTFDRLLGIDKAEIAFFDPGEILSLLGHPPEDSILVYQPVERVVDFNSPRPTCTWKDWITQLLSPPQRPAPADRSCIYGWSISDDVRPREPTVAEVIKAAEGKARVLDRGSAGIGYVVLKPN